MKICTSKSSYPAKMRSKMRVTSLFVAVICLFASINVISCKNIEQQGHQSCSQIKHFFETINVTNAGASLHADQYGECRFFSSYFKF